MAAASSRSPTCTRATQKPARATSAFIECRFLMNERLRCTGKCTKSARATASAITSATIVGIPPMEDFYIGDAVVRIFLPVFKMNFPELVDMTLPAEGVFHNLVFVSIRKQYPYQAFKVMHGLWGMGQMMFSKYIVVVDEDCDVHNTSEVLFR